MYIVQYLCGSASVFVTIKELRWIYRFT